MSMISKLVNDLKRYAETYAMNEEQIFRNPHLGVLLNQAADTIEELSAKLAAANMERSSAYYGGGWITDRVPTKEECGAWGRTFLVTVCANELKTMAMDFEYETVRGEGVCRWKWLGRLSPWEVIAWRELPEPYNADRS